MSNHKRCLLKHMGVDSPVRAYRSAMVADVEELVAEGMEADAAWLQVIDEKLSNLRGEQARIEQSVADAYAKTAAGKAPKPAAAPKPAPAPTPASIEDGDSEAIRQAKPEELTQDAPEESEAQEADTPAGPITDVGEKIGGARKDLWRDRGLNVADLDAMSESEGATLATKANVWKPDYAAIAEASEPVTAAMVKVVYDQLAAQPKKDTPEGRRDYVKAMQAVRKVYGAVTTPEQAKNAYQAMREEVGLRVSFGDGSGFREATGQAATDAKRVLFSVYKGRSDPFVFGYNELARAKKLVQGGFPAKGEPWKTRFIIRAQMGGNLTARGVELTVSDAAALGTPLTEAQAKTGHFRISDKKGKAHGYAASMPEAEALAKRLYENSKAKDEKAEPDRPHLDNIKREGMDKAIDRDATPEDMLRDFGFRGIEWGNWAAQDERQRILNHAYDAMSDLSTILNLPRKALSLNGTMGMAFGARGGGRFAAHYEPGKLVINMTKLRGSGSLAHEWAHAFDHYLGELEKADAYQGKARGASGWYSEDQYTGKPRKRMEKVDGQWTNVERYRLESLRPELAEKIDAVMRALFEAQISKPAMLSELNAALEQTKALIGREQDPNAKAHYERSVVGQEARIAEVQADPEGKTYSRGRSEYAKEAQKLSGKSATGYWLRPTEMWARAFESYVFDKLQGMGAKSDYLVHGVEEERFANPEQYKGNPYPVGAERAAINKAFDAFISELQTKETDKGIALLSQAPAQPFYSALSRAIEGVAMKQGTTGTDPGKLTAMVENIRAGWADAPPVEVVATVLDLPIRFLTELRRAKAMNTARALIVPNTGQVYLIADRLESLADAQAVLFHEVLGHYGLRKFLGADYEKTMRQMRAMNADLAAKSRSWMAAYGTGQIEARVARGMSYADATVEVDLLSVEEALADRAGKPEQISGFKRLVAKLQAWLREHGFMEVAKWLEGKTQAQVLSLLQSARDAVEKAEGVHAYTEPAAALLSQADQTDTPAFKRWFGKSRVVDAEGKPLVVYHGTRADIAAFDGGRIKDRFPNSEGFYFTSNPSHASVYADSINNAAEGFNPASRFAKPAAEGGNVMPVYVSLQNPKILSVSEWGTLESAVDGDGGARVRAARAAGHDGVIVKRRAGDEYDGDLVIAFRPEQIKSATGNSGAFDPSNPSILLSQHTPEQRDALKRAGIAPKRRMKDNIRSAWEAAAGLITDRTDLAQGARQAMLDQFYGIQRAVQRDVGNLPLEQDPYVTARLANGGTSSVMRALLLHGQAQWAANGQHLEKKPGTVGLLDILKPLGDDLNDWFGWMIGNRAARLFKEGRENNFTEDQIKALQALGTPEKIAEFRKAALQYAAFKRSVLDVAEAAGLINKETRPAWDNADYIPFYRQIDEKATFSATGKKGLAGQSSGIRTLKGGESALHDPIENLLMNFSRLIDASLKNNALSRTVRVLEDAKSTALSKTGYTMSAEIVPRSQIEKALADAGTPDYILAGLPPEAFEGMAKMWAIQPPTDPSVIRIMRGGKPQFYKVHDPLLLKAATSFVPFDFPGLGVMRAFKRVLTAMVTATPEFMLRNFIRDSAAVQGIARTGVNPAKSLSGIVRAFKEDGAAEHMLFAGASFQSGNTNAADPTGTATSIRRALRQKGMDAAAIDGFMATIVDKPARLWELYKHVGEAIENANREAIFEATAKKGSVTAAAYEAKDLMDFSLRGSSPLYQLAADVLPFFNARVQGLYRVGRSNPARLAVYAGIMAALSVALVMANSGEDWYDELPDWDKDAYWHFMLFGTHYRLPKPFELGVAFATIPERIARYLDGQDSGSKTVGRLFANVRDQLAFDPIPQAIRPAMNVWANKDTFRGAPIENIADEGKLPHQRYGATTSETARLVTDTLAPATDAIGLSPKKLEYLIGGYLGTVGTYALGAADMVVRELQDAPVQPAPRLDDLPIVKAFVREAPARSTVYENDLYTVREHIEQVYRSASALAREGKTKEARAMLEEYKPEIKARGTVLGAAATLAGIRREREKVYADRAMTPEAKRERLDELQVMENKAVKKAMTDPKVKALQ